ncbi:MAG TPA: hypothetical protein PKC76_03420 [Saprospiraceae bacterium]|nr:hypothetical protein [Saprospiraceae bacterium]HMP23154.1 hypothetical protein [Saprospiraceae bacterium]
MKYLPYSLFVVLFAAFTACTEPPNYPDEPYIEFVGMNKNAIAQGSASSPRDTLAITFFFTDGNGDIGSDTTNFFLRDSRDNSLIPNRLFPIPEQGSGNGVSGEITIRIPNKVAGPNICCIFPDRRVCQTDPRFPQDTFSYSIQIKDRAGNLSNIIRTPPITILCR